MREQARFQDSTPTPPQTSKRTGRSTTLPILQSSYSMMSPITVTEWGGWGAEPAVTLVTGTVSVVGGGVQRLPPLACLSRRFEEENQRSGGKKNGR